MLAGSAPLTKQLIVLLAIIMKLPSAMTMWAAISIGPRGSPFGQGLLEPSFPASVGGMHGLAAQGSRCRLRQTAVQR